MDSPSTIRCLSDLRQAGGRMNVCELCHIEILESRVRDHMYAEHLTYIFEKNWRRYSYRKRVVG